MSVTFQVALVACGETSPCGKRKHRTVTTGWQDSSVLEQVAGIVDRDREVIADRTAERWIERIVVY